MRRIIGTIACFILGPFFAWHGLSDLITASRAASWPTAQGVIQSVDVTEISGRRNTTTYTPVVKYSYEVGSASFAGDRIDYGGQGHSSMADAMGIAARYREGEHLPVHYNPKTPATAVLEVGTTTDNWLVLGVGVLMTGVGVILAVGIWRRLNSNDFAPSSGF